MPRLKEKRRHARREIRLDGIVILPDGRQVNCKLSDISETGALLALETPHEMPHRFMLKIERPVPVYRFCELMRQEGAMIGVHYPNRPQLID